MPIDRIDGVSGFHRPESTGQPKRPDPREVDGAGQGSGGDRVELSERARLAAALRARAGELPEVREDRVEAVREALETGTYEVDPRRLAAAILEFEDGLDR